ncbi:GNAT family N-acetyltransferase [Pseudomonas sp. BF-R-24]|uniref:GNAT family N-acetyltransferase n=1 Tax=Pseudomonas sp. BF-R-24 TaxID=2832386 RepID=UPI001CBAA0BC|nr:GNAT family N-acetyltransferase [Pseudomonas sp. BF-R-24]
MPVSSARLIYRKPELSDGTRLFEIYSDPQTQLFNPAGPMRTTDQAEALLSTWIEHWTQQGFGWWAIAEKASPDYIIGFGGVGYYDYLGDLRLNVGYRFASVAWGKGYATEMGKFALNLAFTTPGNERIWAVVRPDHTASIKVLEKIGMQRCGVLDDAPGMPASLVFEIEKI